MDGAAINLKQSDTDEPEHRVVPFARPSSLTSFFGRTEEIASLLGLVRSGTSLITITGPGGVGKTRLALSILAELTAAGLFPDGVHFIPLASVADESLVVPTIARTLGIVAEDGTAPVDRLREALQHRMVLLVLDNFEHLLGAALDLAKLHNGCPDLTIITTSRRALRLIGEQEFPLAPLPVARLGLDASPSELADSPAIALFLSRASAANPRFVITESNAQSIAQICARLDGLPLAIELAAARVKLMSPQALLSRLSGRLQLLNTGRRDVPRRQQTLRDAITWSYDLLTPEEQALFRRLSVFAGGATLDAIDAVLGQATAEGFIDSLDATAALVDHSLLLQEEGVNGEPRFRMLETIREYGLERLEAAGEAESTRDAHALFYTSFAARVAEPEYGPEESALLAGIAPELDNVRAALTWLLDNQPFDSPRAHMGLRLAGSMVRFWDVRGYLQEETRWLVRALSLVTEAPTRERATALTALGVNAWFLGDFDVSISRQQFALSIARHLDDPRAIVRSLWFIGLVASKRGDIAHLEALSAEVAPLAPHLGITLWRVVPESLLALAALAAGDGRRTEELLQGAAAFHLEHGFHWPHAWVMGIMAEAATLQGDNARALAFFQQSLAEFHRHGDIYATLDGLTAIAGNAANVGQADVAARLLGSVAVTRATVGKRITWLTFSEEEAIASARAAMTEDEFELGRVTGRALSLDEAVALALGVMPTAAVVVHVKDDLADSFGLSPREREVLRLLTEGKSNDEIGVALFISSRTAGTHVANILGKLGVHSRAAAVAVAARNGLF